MRDAATSPDGIEIAYEVEGAGDPAIVLVHGWSCDRAYWRKQLAPLAARTRVVAIDLAGHGESGAGRASWTMPAYGDDVVAVVDQLELGPTVLVGHSMGGDVILEAALVLGDRVAGVVWVDVYRKLGEPDTPEEIERFVAPFRRDFAGQARPMIRHMFPSTADPDLVDWIVEDMASAPPDVGLAAMEQAVSNQGRATEVLGMLRVPVVAINPDFRPTDTESLELHGIRTVFASGVGHFPMLEDPGQFNRLLEDVVEGFGRGA
jgi:pimeloyl-ACP methyl ester carboxylesterase